MKIKRRKNPKIKLKLKIKLRAVYFREPLMSESAFRAARLATIGKGKCTNGDCCQPVYNCGTKLCYICEKRKRGLIDASVYRD